jgi:tagatose-6-phosphate ketose/aldose isomerase
MMAQGLDKWATWSEILAQPSVWRSLAQSHVLSSTRAWIAERQTEEVWFCGSGTSAYIGDILVAGLEGQRGPFRLRSVPATDLVARPRDYLHGRAPLVVNFGRSGNSAETLGTLEALDALAASAPRLNITCNASSQLAKQTRHNDHAIILPEAAHDSGFAMTSSFSTMLLTALMLFDATAEPQRLETAASQLEAVFPAIYDAVGPRPERVAFVGSGAMTFAAREAALKVMELSAGQIPCLWDSILGFRHGPKSFVDDQTRLVVFTGYDSHASAYEADLIAELKTQFPRSMVTVIGPGGDVPCDHPHGPLWSVPQAVLFAQVASVVWADGLGMNVDDPFAGQGTLTRVVADVKLYEVSP